jgi:hypothetical protein
VSLCVAREFLSCPQGSSASHLRDTQEQEKVSCGSCGFEVRVRKTGTEFQVQHLFIAITT